MDRPMDDPRGAHHEPGRQEEASAWLGHDRASIGLAGIGVQTRRHNVGVILLTGILLAIFVVPDPWKWPVLIGFAVLEVGETIFTWRFSRRWRTKVGPETLVGSVGRAITDCRPDGRVRVRGEDWQARCEAGVESGQKVRVVDRERLTLIVEPLVQG
jgi:membrane-bound ClpP family serine protease